MDMNVILLIGALVIALVVVSIRLYRCPKCSCSKDCQRENYCCQKGLQFLSELAEAGLLAQKVEESQQQLELDRIKIDALLEEIHSLIFFRYLKSEREAMFKRSLESKVLSYREQAESACFSRDEKRALAEVFEALLKELDGTWNTEKDNENA